MKILPHLFLVWLFSAAIASASWEITETRTLGALRGGGEVREVQISDSGLTARLTAVVFHEKAFTLRVIDSPAPGESKLAQVMPGTGCVAGVNGGFFHEDYRPLGLVVANGQTLHPFEKAALLSGLLTVRDGHIDIVRSGAFKPGRDLRQALQSGPMLVEGGAPLPGLNGERSARRTIVATDGHGHWALVYLT